MKRFFTLTFAATLSALAFGVPAQATRIIQMKKYSESQLKKSCDKAGGSFDSGPGGYSCNGKNGQVLCKRTEKHCYAYVDSAKQQPSGSLGAVLQQITPRKRPKVLQEGGADGQGETVNPDVLGGGNPRAAPDGNMPDITGGDGIQ